MDYTGALKQAIERQKTEEIHRRLQPADADLTRPAVRLRLAAVAAAACLSACTLEPDTERVTELRQAAAWCLAGGLERAENG